MYHLFLSKKHVVSRLHFLLKRVSGSPAHVAHAEVMQLFYRFSSQAATAKGARRQSRLPSVRLSNLGGERVPILHRSSWGGRPEGLTSTMGTRRRPNPRSILLSAETCVTGLPDTNVARFVLSSALCLVALQPAV